MFNVLLCIFWSFNNQSKPFIYRNTMLSIYPRAPRSTRPDFVLCASSIPIASMTRTCPKWWPYVGAHSLCAIITEMYWSQLRSFRECDDYKTARCVILFKSAGSQTNFSDHYTLTARDYYGDALQLMLFPRQFNYIVYLNKRRSLACLPVQTL